MRLCAQARVCNSEQVRTVCWLQGAGAAAELAPGRVGPCVGASSHPPTTPAFSLLPVTLMHLGTRPARRCGAAGLHAGWRPPGVLHHPACGGRRRRGGLRSAAVELPAGRPLQKAVECSTLQVAEVPGEGRKPAARAGATCRLLLAVACPAAAWPPPGGPPAPSPRSWRCPRRTQPYLDLLEDEEGFLAGADDKFLTVAESPDSSLLGECLPPAGQLGVKAGSTPAQPAAAPCESSPRKFMRLQRDTLQWCMDGWQAPQTRPAATASWPTS